MGEDDALDGSQPEPATRELGREEGVKNSRDGFGVHAASGVTHGQTNIVFRRQVGLWGEVAHCRCVMVHEL